MAVVGKTHLGFEFFDSVRDLHRGGCGFATVRIVVRGT